MLVQEYEENEMWDNYELQLCNNEFHKNETSLDTFSSEFEVTSYLMTMEIDEEGLDQLEIIIPSAKITELIDIQFITCYHYLSSSNINKKFSTENIRLQLSSNSSYQSNKTPHLMMTAHHITP